MVDYVGITVKKIQFSSQNFFFFFLECAGLFAHREKEMISE